MERFFNIHEAVKILREHYITDSIQMASRWIREGKIAADRTENRKEGWRIKEGDLYDFIEELRPGLISMAEAYKSFIDFYPLDPSSKISSDDDDHLNPKEPRPVYIEKKETENEEANQKPTQGQSKEINHQINEIKDEILRLKQDDQSIKEQVSEIFDRVLNFDERFDKISDEYDYLSSQLSKLDKLDEIEKALKQQQYDNPISTNDEDKGEDKPLKKQQMTRKAFLKLAREMLEDEYRETISEYYSTYFDENKTVKNELYDAEGNICCPINKNNSSKHLKIVLKKSFPIMLEQIIENENRTEQIESNLADDVVKTDEETNHDNLEGEFSGVIEEKEEL